MCYIALCSVSSDIYFKDLEGVGDLVAVLQLFAAIDSPTNQVSVRGTSQSPKI